MEDKKLHKFHKSSGKHKHKRSKKHKKERHSSDSDVEMEWVEAAPPEKRRETWMTQEEEFVRTLTRDQMKEGEISSREKKRKAQEQRIEEEKTVLRSRELNPHLSRGGLPEEEPVSEPRLPSLSVGDGGFAFLTKARIRVREQAEREGRSMEEVAVERWGSLSALDNLITEAEERMHCHSRQRHRTKDDFSPNRMMIQYQKPRERHGRCNISSSRKEKGRNHDKVASEQRRSHAKESSCEREASERMFCDNREEPKARRPAWKKIKYEEGTSSREISRDSSPKKELVKILKDSKEEDSINRLATRHLKAELAEESGLLLEKEKDFHTSGGGSSSLNRLAARRMRAELSGDSVLATLLLEEEKAFQTSGGSGQERVMLTKMDSSGQQRPVLSSREDAGFERRTDRQKKRPNKYFDDSSKYSLKQMFEREKLTTSEDNLEMFLEVSAEFDDSKEENETSGISKRAMQKMSHTGQEEKDIQKAMQQHQKLSSALERCEYCLDQVNMKQHLIVDIQEQVFVCVPDFQSLVSGHCLVVPKRHVPSLLHLDEDEWKDFQEAVGSIRCMFRSQGKSLLCLETSLQFSRCPHAVAECIPLPPELGDMAPFYFKKAILESEEEWAHNVKLVDLSSKGLRRSIPKNLPYFCVMFDPSVHGGYAHVIEDEKAFPRNFGKEVVGGMMDIDYNHLYKNRREDPMKKSKEAADFTRMWEKYKESSSL